MKRLSSYMKNESTLADMYKDMGHIVRPFVTLNIVDTSGNTLISNTIPNAMIFIDPHRNELIQIMSSNGTQSTWIGKDQMSKYVYTRGETFIHYIFTMVVPT